VTALDQSERDAMKPVDDGSIMVEEEGEVEYDDEPPITMQIAITVITRTKFRF
jgi:hypothetical protein